MVFTPKHRGTPAICTKMKIKLKKDGKVAKFRIQEIEKIQVGTLITFHCEKFFLEDWSRF
jgi:hypothetical protein